MDLNDALRTTAAVRAFTDQQVTDDTLGRVLDAARFAPSGGNRQGWRVVVVKDPGVRGRLRDLYLDGWYEYLALGAAGLVPWSPTSDRAAEAAALGSTADFARQGAQGGGGFAEHLDEVPALLLVLGDLSAMAAVDRDLPRYTFAGGASIYPFCWSILLAGRGEGLAGVITTMAVRAEAEVKALVGAPATAAVAAVIALGYPVVQPRRLRRREVPAFTTIDHCEGAAFPT